MQLSRSFANIPEDQVCFGYISGIFGVHGEVRIFLYNPESRFLFTERSIFLLDSKGNSQSYRMKARTGAGKKIIASIKGLRSREDAREKIGHQITFLKKHLPSLVEGEWYHHQLLGMQVHTESGEFLGSIVEILPGEIEVWVCESDDQTAYIPYTEEDVLSVSIDTGVVVPDE